MEFITPGIEERQRQLDEIKRRELKEENEKRAKEVEASNERVRAATEGRERAAIEAERLAKAQQERKKFAPSPQRYVYKMAQIPPNITVDESAHHGGEAASYLERIVNQFARDGWEFYRVDSIGVVIPPGCLSALFGGSSQRDSYYVITFRKPLREEMI